jgi:hypothetical protein
MEQVTRCYRYALLPGPSGVGGWISQGRGSRNGARKILAKNGGRTLMIRTDEKRKRAVEVADPDLPSAGVEIEGALFVDLGNGIGGGKNLDADLGSALEQGQLANILGARRGEPGNVDGFDAAGSGKRALRHNFAGGKQLVQKNADMDLALAMKRSWRRTHENVAMLIGLNAVGEPGEIRVGQNLGPTSQVNPGLRGEIREFDGDGHGGEDTPEKRKEGEKGNWEKNESRGTDCYFAALVVNSMRYTRNSYLSGWMRRSPSASFS